MKEEELFNFIRDFGYSDLKKSTDVYSVWDCYSQEHNIYIELKCRRTHYEKLLIEESKFNRLTKIATEKSMIPIYICSTPKGIWAFNLSGAILTWVNEKMPATTDFANTKFITKSVSYVDIKFGLQLA